MKLFSMLLHNAQNSWFMIFLVILTAFQFFPLWLSWSSPYDEDLYQSLLGSTHVKVAAGFALGFLSIIFIDLTVDLLFTKTYGYQFWISRSIYFWVVFFQILIILFQGRISSVTSVYICYTRASSFLLLATAAIDLCDFDRTKSWTRKLAVPFLFCACLGLVFNTMESHSGSAAFRICNIVFKISAVIFFMLQGSYAIRNILKSHEGHEGFIGKMRALSFDDSIVVFTSIAVVSCWLSLLLLQSITVDASVARIAGELIIKLVFATILKLIPSLLLKRKAARLAYDLDVKRLFVRCVSHEIRTPLNVAIAGLDIVKRTCNFDSDADTASLIDDIQDSCKVAVTIVDDLLAYEKLSSGEMALDKSIVEVKSLILSTVSMFNLQARSKEIAFSVLENEDAILSPTYFQVDSGKITQVLRNFISNAMKFTPEHGTVRIEATASDGIVTIRVIDSGVGIAAENLPKVFRDIVQFDVNKNQKGGGSGMGLWLSKQIVDLHGGAVAVSSEGLGKGCCFEVRLRTVIDASASFLNPPVIVVPVNHLQPQNNISTRSQRVHPLPSHHCLVVDDSKLSRKVMVRFLQLLDYATEEVGDGMQCVDAVKQGAICHFSLVLIDNSMPVLSGPDAVIQLRGMGYRGIIIGVTGNALPEDMRHFVKSGANEVLVKPVTYEMLEQCLVRHGLRPK